MTNTRREPCVGWMIALLMVVSFVIRCVDRMCRSDVSIGCVDRMCHSFLSECLFSFFLHYGFWPCRYKFFDLSLPVGDKFF